MTGNHTADWTEACKLSHSGCASQLLKVAQEVVYSLIANKIVKLSGNNVYRSGHLGAGDRAGA